MNNNNDFTNKIVKNTINVLAELGFHSLHVKSKQEAKNFIMYHVGVETLVALEECKEINELNIEQAIIEKGGTILNEEEDTNYINVTSKNSIIKVQLYGGKYMFDNEDFILKYYVHDKSYSCDRVKTIIVVLVEYTDVLTKNINDFVKQLIDFRNKLKNKLYINLNNKETIYNDISVIFIG